MSEKSVMKIYRLSQEENEEFKRKVKAASMPEAQLIRLLIKGYRPPNAPGDEFHDDMNKLLKAAEELRDIARRSRDEDVKEPLKEASKELRHLRMQLQEKYLKGERINIKWQ